MTKPFKSETRYRENWAVTISASPEGEGFFTECRSPEGAIWSTEVCKDKGSAWQEGYNLVDRIVSAERSQTYNSVALPLTIALLYVCGGDEYDESYEAGCEPKLIGRRAWKGYDFNILHLLTDQGLLEEQRYPRQVKSVVLTPKGIKQAREILRSLNLEGAERFLQMHNQHEPG